MRDQAHVVSLRISGTPGESPPEVVGYVVSRIWFHSWVYPWITGILLVVLAGNIASLGWAIWDWRRRGMTEDDLPPVEESAYHCSLGIPDVALEGSGYENDSA